MKARLLLLATALSCHVESEPLGPADDLGPRFDASDAAAIVDLGVGDLGFRDLGLVDLGSPLPRDSCASNLTKHGLRWDETPAVGVWCGGELCSEGCCFSITTGCKGSGSSCRYAEVLCDGPEDCSNGQVCCMDGPEASRGVTRGAACADRCSADGDRLCQRSADCSASQACVRGWSNEGRLQVGRCQERGPSDCHPSAPGACTAADLSGSDMVGVDLSEGELQSANLRDVHWRFGSLEDADLRSACLEGGYFHQMSMTGVDLREARVRDARLPSELRGARLDLADLRGVTLAGSDLEDASLRDAQVDDARLNQVVLRGADLRGASFSGAQMLNVDLTGALTTGEGFEGGAIYLGVVCPDGTPAPMSTDRLRCDDHWSPEGS